MSSLFRPPLSFEPTPYNTEAHVQISATVRWTEETSVFLPRNRIGYPFRPVLKLWKWRMSQNYSTKGVQIQ